MKPNRLTIVFLAAMVPFLSPAATLKIASVSAPEVWCLFAPNCSVTVTDSAGQFAIPGLSGQATLVSRTFPAQAGSPGAGNYVYLYRLDLANVSQARPPICALTLTVPNPGAPVQMDFNADRVAEDIFVVTNGTGTAAVTAAEFNQQEITFQFGNGLCPPEGSLFFGFVSPGPPADALGRVTDASGNVIQGISLRAPTPSGSEISLQLNPAHGIAGSRFVATGKVSPQAAGARFFWNNGVAMVGLAETGIGQDGSFNVGLVAPQDAPPGTVEVSVLGMGTDDPPAAAQWTVDPTPPANIQGGVTTSVSGREQPVADAEVRLVDAGGWPVGTTRTGSDGSYRFPGLSPGDYGVMVIKDGLFFEESTVKASAGQTAVSSIQGVGGLQVPANAYVSFVGAVALSYSSSITYGLGPLLISDQATAKATQRLALLPALGKSVPGLPVRFWADVQFPGNPPASERRVVFELIDTSGKSVFTVNKTDIAEVVPGDPIFGFKAYTSTPGLIDFNAHLFPPGALALRVTQYVGDQKGVGKLYWVEMVDLEHRWLNPWVKADPDPATGWPLRVLSEFGRPMYILNGKLPQPELSYGFDINLGIKNFNNSIKLGVPFQEVFVAEPGKGLSPSYVIPAALNVEMQVLSQSIFKDKWAYQATGTPEYLTYNIGGATPVTIANKTFGPFTIYSVGPGIFCFPLCLIDCEACAGYKLWVDLKFGATLGLQSTIHQDLALEAKLIATGSATLGGHFKAKAGADVPGIGDIGCSANADVTGTGKLYLPFKYYSAPTASYGFESPCVSIQGSAAADFGCVGINLGGGGNIGPYYWPGNCTGGATATKSDFDGASGPFSSTPSPAVAADGAGQAIAIWIGDMPDAAPGTAPVLYYSLFDGRTWLPAGLLTAEPASIGSPKVTFRAPGDAIAVWAQNRLSLDRLAVDGRIQLANQEIFYSRWNAQTWSRPQPVTTDENVDASPVVAASPGGDMTMAVWVRRLDPPPTQPSNNIIAIVSSTFDGANWTAPSPIEVGYPQVDAAPDLAFDRQGLPWAVWQRHLDGDFKTYADRQLMIAGHSGRGWNVPELIPGVPPGAFAPSIALDMQGRPLVLFTVPSPSEDGSIGPGIGNRNTLWYAFKRSSGWEVGPVGTRTFAELPVVRITSDNQATVLFRRFGEEITRLTGDVGSATTDLNQPALRWALDYLTQDGETNWEIAYDVDRETSQHVSLVVKRPLPESEPPPTTPDRLSRGNPVRLNIAQAVSPVLAVRFDHRPDLALAPEDVAFSKSYPDVSETITITANVHNLGFQAANSFSVRFYEALSQSWVLIGEKTVMEPLGSGASTLASISYLVRAAGPKTIRVVVDEPGTVAETDETNNRAEAMLGKLAQPAMPVILTDAGAGRMLIGGIQGTNHIKVTKVYRASNTNRFEMIGATTEQTFVDRLARPGTQYYYRLVTVDAFGTPSDPSPAAPGLLLPAVQAVRSGSSLVLSWPRVADGFVLEETTSLIPPAWRASTLVPVSAGDLKQVTIPLDPQGRYYRLVK